MLYETRWLGSVEYSLAAQMQETLAERVKLSGNGIILGLEHPEVITLGLRGNKNDIVGPTKTPIIIASRGGQATYHNPGQLVIYPICPMRKWGFGARDWVSALTKVTQQTLLKCNIILIDTNNGFYTKNGKIASIGLNLKGGVSTHGIAINVSNHLSGFSKIYSCGVKEQPIDRVANTSPISPEALFSLWCDTFTAAFSDNLDRALTSEPIRF